MAAGKEYPSVRYTVAETQVSRIYQSMTLSRCVINEGRENELICTGYKESKLWTAVYYACSVMTFGLFFLVCYWLPAFKLKIRSRVCTLEKATHVIVADKFKQSFVKRIQVMWLNDTQGDNKQNEDDISVKEIDPENEMKNSLARRHVMTFADVKSQVRPIRYFEHQFRKYLWIPEIFLPLKGIGYKASLRKLQDKSMGVSEQDEDYRRTVYGRNSITLKITPYPVILFREIVNPFYAFQLFSIIVWAVQGYFILSIVIAILSTVSISLSLYMTRKLFNYCEPATQLAGSCDPALDQDPYLKNVVLNLEEYYQRQSELLNKMSSGSGFVKVLKGSEFVMRSSADLVPGDVIEIENKPDAIWCDCVLLSGSCIVNESTLTGESIPVTKTPLANSDVENSEVIYSRSRHKQHTLYSGTEVMCVNLNQQNGSDLPRALVLKTGFYTKRGKMIESMASPTPMDYKFYKDSLKFILVMAILGVIGGIITIGLLASQNSSASHVVSRVLDLITIVVPPGLPAALTIATLYAQRRLKLAKIMCISPPRINISGKVNCMCFDKTGTLTEDHMTLWGIIPNKYNGPDDTSCVIGDNSNRGFYDPLHDFSKLIECGQVGRECMRAMASCHALVCINGEILGDPLELELFRANKWNVETSENETWFKDCNVVYLPENSEIGPIGAIQSYQFNSVLKRMSVVVKQAKAASCNTAYVKGAPEIIASLCNMRSLPSDFDEKVQYYTRRGYRVLAFAYRHLEKDARYDNRKTVECDLQFLALAVFVNPLKEKSKETISTLRNANIRTIMSTGDNLDTAINVARLCNMVSKQEKITILEANRLGESKQIELTNDVNVAMTGDTFTILRSKFPELCERLLPHSTVFARMNPVQKKQLVEKLQEQENYTVAMCGDGANDCGALKSAHVGIALADLHTAIFAPFTSREKNISCCIKIIREGRAALVTSFGMIKYLCLYSLVQYTALIVLYTIDSYMSDVQFILADVGITGVVTLFFAIGGAAKALAKRPPHLSLVSPIILICLFFQIMLIMIFEAASFATLKAQPWHTPLVRNITHPQNNIVCEENTVMFYTATFQYLILALAMYKTRNYRRPIYTNVPYFILLIVMSCFALLLLFGPVPPIDSWFSLTQLNYNVAFKMILLAFVLVHLVLALVIENFILESTLVDRLSDVVRKKYRHNKNSIGNSETNVTESSVAQKGVKMIGDLAV